MLQSTVAMVTSSLETPIGRLELGAAEDGILLRVGLPGLSAPFPGRTSDAVLAPVRDALAGYFAGDAPDWDFALRPDGTDFQREVWRTLLTIPYATTWSYGTLAQAVGRPGAARAVGAANRANPIPIVIPCHRVIGADGSLTGYAGLGGLGIKRFLLDLETGASLPLAIV